MKTIADIIHHKKIPMEILDPNGNRIYYESVLGFWSKRQYDSDGTETYYEHSYGEIIEADHENNCRHNPS